MILALLHHSVPIQIVDDKKIITTEDTENTEKKGQIRAFRASVCSVLSVVIPDREVIS